MSWDAVAWARSTGIEAGTPNTVPPLPPMPDGGVIAIEREAWLARVQPTAAIGTIELELRAAGWTLGPLPEDSERLPVVSAIATDQSSLAGSGAGFTTRRYDESSQGLRLRIRPMPAAQAGCAVLLPDFTRGLEALRQLGQRGHLPDEAILLDRNAIDLWLSAAEIGESTAPLLRPEDALLLMIGAGPSGTAAERMARAAASLTDLGAETLGQDVAQAWAATRDRVVTAAPTLLGAGYDFERREARRTWSEPVVDPRQEGSWVGLEATGADAHSVLLRARRLSAAT
jgi:hypothetical protein